MVANRNQTVAFKGEVTEALAKKSRGRRDTMLQLSETITHAPPPRNDLSPQLNLQRVAISTLKPATRRVRRANAAQIARIKSSLCNFGVSAPVLVSAEGQIVHGHLVVQAARELGVEEISCVSMDHLSPAQQRSLAISLNKLGETGEWDFPELQFEVQELTALGEDLVVTGFAAAEIDLMLFPGEVSIAGADAEAIPELGKQAISRTDDVWLAGDQKLLHGDARDRDGYARLFAGDKKPARLLLTDEPYNRAVRTISGNAEHREFAMASGEMNRDEFVSFNREWMKTGMEYVMDGGLVSTAIDWRSIDVVMEAARDLGLTHINTVVWSKTNAGQGSLWRSAHEFYPFFKKGSDPHINNVMLGRYGRWRSNVWTYPGGASLGSDSRAGLELHPTVKPRALLEDALLDVTERGDIVIDCFAGSGSMVVAAQATGRRCRAIEIDGLYCDMIIRRWEAMTGQDALLQGSGETFAEVAERRAGVEEEIVGEEV